MKKKYCDSWNYPLFSFSFFMIEAVHQVLLRLRACVSFNYRSRSSMKNFRYIYIYITQSIGYNRQKKRISVVCYSNGISVKCFSCWFDQANAINVSCICRTLFTRSRSTEFSRLMTHNYNKESLTLVECAFCLLSMLNLPIMLNCSKNSNRKKKY